MSGAELGFFDGKENLENKRLPRGLTTEPSNQMSSLITEMRAAEPNVVAVVSDGRGWVFSVYGVALLELVFVVANASVQASS